MNLSWFIMYCFLVGILSIIFVHIFCDSRDMLNFSSLLILGIRTHILLYQINYKKKKNCAMWWCFRQWLIWCFVPCEKILTTRNYIVISFQKVKSSKEIIQWHKISSKSKLWKLKVILTQAFVLHLECSSQVKCHFDRFE